MNKTNGLRKIRKENDRAFYNPLSSLHHDSNIAQGQLLKTVLPPIDLTLGIWLPRLKALNPFTNKLPRNQSSLKIKISFASNNNKKILKQKRAKEVLLFWTVTLQSIIHRRASENCFMFPFESKGYIQSPIWDQRTSKVYTLESSRVKLTYPCFKCIQL